jgi:hypothetical protein
VVFLLIGLIEYILLLQLPLRLLLLELVEEVLLALLECLAFLLLLAEFGSEGLFLFLLVLELGLFVLSDGAKPVQL